ncbi:hypothetical protein SAMN02745830_07069 [Streptomyces sp. Amel2xC10]|nr:hypothetical protein SAMN02745830_07069 [Streptomyces sp. Amel2xC10]
MTGYGIAMWAGLEEEVFTVGELLVLAAEAVGGQCHHMVAVQVSVSLVKTSYPRAHRPGAAMADHRRRITALWGRDATLPGGVLCARLMAITVTRRGVTPSGSIIC